MKKDDPYAGLGVEIDVDPYEGLGVVEVKTPRTKKPRTDAAQIAGVTTNAFTPYATAAALGAAAGGIPTGGIGAIPGAGAGMLALGVGDIGTSIYNLGGSLFGADRIPLPSETISKGYRSVGIGRAPETRGQQVYSDVLQAGVSGGGMAKGFQLAENVATSPQTRNFMNMMGQNVRGQTGAAIGAGGAPSVASNYFGVTDPTALMGLSLAGGGLGYKAATPKTKPVTAAELKQESRDLYDAMKAENVNIAPQAITDLGAQVRTKLSTLPYDPDTDDIVNQALKMIDLKAGKPIPFNMMDKFRRKIRDLPYNKSGTSSVDNDERAVIEAIDDLIDDFMDGLTPAQITSGDAAAAARLLTKARGVRARSYQTETLEGAFKKASDASKHQDNPRPFAQGLRAEFKSIADNPRKINKFDAPTQKLIKQVADGTITQKGLMALGKFSPSARIFGVQVPFIGYGAQYAPGTAAAITGVQLTTAAAKGAANQMTKSQANRALISAAQPGGGIKPGGRGFFALSPIAQQNVMAQDRAKQRKR